MEYYKVLGDDGKPIHGGSGTWSLPRKENGVWIPGEWMPKIDNPSPCARGYHGLRREDIRKWIGPNIYALEFRGGIITCDDKVVGGEARLLSRFESWSTVTMLQWTADVAEHTLPIYEAKYPTDDRPRKAIEACRAYAAAHAAAYAAHAAACATAYAAADAACAAAYAAHAAACAAACAVYAADAAAHAVYAATHAVYAADAAEVNWQTDRIFFYLNGEAVR